jgi:hypothetical protein
LFIFLSASGSGEEILLDPRLVGALDKGHGSPRLAILVS